MPRLSAPLLLTAFARLRWGVTLGVIAVVIAPAGASTSSSAPPRLPATIVLDRSIGGVAVLDRKSVVEKRIGHGHVTPVGGRSFLVTYPRYGIQIAYVPRGPLEVVMQVETESPRYRTRQGVHVGSTRASVKALPGTIYCPPRYPDRCDHWVGHRSGAGPGTAFEFDSRGRVRWIGLGDTSL